MNDGGEIRGLSQLGGASDAHLNSPRGDETSGNSDIKSVVPTDDPDQLSSGTWGEITGPCDEAIQVAKGLWQVQEKICIFPKGKSWRKEHNKIHCARYASNAHIQPANASNRIVDSEHKSVSVASSSQLGNDSRELYDNVGLHGRLRGKEQSGVSDKEHKNTRDLLCGSAVRREDLLPHSANQQSVSQLRGNSGISQRNPDVVDERRHDIRPSHQSRDVAAEHIVRQPVSGASVQNYKGHAVEAVGPRQK